jgi:sugar lactone lactonase YvrE
VNPLLAQESTDDTYKTVALNQMNRLSLEGKLEDITNLDPRLDEFSEGPAWHPDGYLLFSSFNLKTDGFPDILKLENGKVSLFLESSGSNGLALDRSGQNLFLANKIDDRIDQVRIEKGQASTMRTLVSRYQGACFWGPNDLFVDSKGGVWFTDPAYDAKNNLDEGGCDGPRDANGEAIQGLYYLAPGSTEAVLLYNANQGPWKEKFPNGLAIDHDESAVYLNLNGTNRILKFKVNWSKGSPQLSDAQIFTEKVEGPDGLAIDEHGRLWVASFTGRKVVVLSPKSADVLLEIETLMNATNIDFAPKGQVFITGYGGVGFGGLKRFTLKL